MALKRKATPRQLQLDEIWFMMVWVRWFWAQKHEPAPSSQFLLTTSKYSDSVMQATQNTDCWKFTITRDDMNKINSVDPSPYMLHGKRADSDCPPSGPYHGEIMGKITLMGHIGVLQKDGKKQDGLFYVVVGKGEGRGRGGEKNEGSRVACPSPIIYWVPSFSQFLNNIGSSKIRKHKLTILVILLTLKKVATELDLVTRDLWCIIMCMISISPKVYQTFDLMGPIIDSECSKFFQVKSSDLLWLQKQLKQLHKLDEDGITKIFRAGRSWRCGATHILGSDRHISKP